MLITKDDDNTQGKRVYSIGGVATTQTSTGRSWGAVTGLYEMDGKIRSLTPNESEVVQGFPSGWTEIDGVTDRRRYKMIGNAVPPQMVSVVLDKVLGEKPSNIYQPVLF